jgi:hypothetical protein
MDSSLILKVVCYELANLSNANRKKSASGGEQRRLFARRSKTKPVNQESQNPVHSRGQICETHPHQFMNIDSRLQQRLVCVAVIDQADDAVRPEGWNDWEKTEAHATLRCAEFNRTGAGANPAKRADWTKPLGETEAMKITVEKVLGGWNPAK